MAVWSGEGGRAARGRPWPLVMAIVLALLAVPASAGGGNGAGSGDAAVPMAGPPTAPDPAMANDVNGDGYADLIVGAPEGVVDGERGGYVSVVPGSSEGLDIDDAHLVDPASLGARGTSGRSDRFGAVVRSGDVDGDGYADLVAADPGAPSGPQAGAGLVWIVFGSRRGLSREAIAIPDPGEGERVAATMVEVADFDGDGYADVVTDGRRNEDRTGVDEDLVLLFPGAPGLRGSAPPEPVSFDTTMTMSGIEFSGSTQALFTGDVNGDGHPDLAVGGYHDDPADQGDVVVFAGSDGGLETEPRWGPTEIGSESYQVMDLGDVNGDGHADAVVPDGGYRGGGRSYPGGADGLGEAVHHQEFDGDSVAVGDVDGDGHGDLVLGFPWEAGHGDAREAGDVRVRYGGDAWISDRERDFSQGSDGVSGTAEEGDRFGAEVTLLDLNGDGYPDLVAAAPGENGGDGAVTVVYGSPEGPDAEGARTIDGDTLGHNGAKAGFGSALPAPVTGERR